MLNKKFLVAAICLAVVVAIMTVVLFLPLSPKRNRPVLISDRTAVVSTKAYTVYWNPGENQLEAYIGFKMVDSYMAEATPDNTHWHGTPCVGYPSSTGETVFVGFNGNEFYEITK